MMQTAQARAGNHRRLRTRLFFDCPAMRRVFATRVVNAVLVKVGDVFPDQPPQVPFVERNHMVQQLAPTTSHPAFRDAILPRRCDTCALRFETGRLEECDDFDIELLLTMDSARVPCAPRWEALRA